MLSGRPKAAVFRSGPTSQWRDRYNISWAVDSHAPVEEFKLFFRRLPAQGMAGDSGILSGDLTGEQLQPLQHQSQQHGRRPARRVSFLCQFVIYFFSWKDDMPLFKFTSIKNKSFINFQHRYFFALNR